MYLIENISLWLIYISCAHLLWCARTWRAHMFTISMVSVFFHTFISGLIYSNHFFVMIRFSHIWTEEIYQHWFSHDLDICMWNEFSFIPPRTLSWRSTVTIWRRLAIIFQNNGKVHWILKLNVFASYKAFHIIFCARESGDIKLEKSKVFYPLSSFLPPSFDIGAILVAT